MSDLSVAPPESSTATLHTENRDTIDVAVVAPPTWMATFAHAGGEGMRQAVTHIAIEKLAVHSACDYLPFYEPSYQRVLASVRDRGVLFPLATSFDGKVIDGRYRLRAAREAGLATLPVLSVDTVGTDDASVARWAFTMKDAREHLSEDERAVLAVQYQRQLKGEHVKVRAAKMVAGRKAKAAKAAPTTTAGKKNANTKAAKAKPVKRDSRKEAREHFKVSERKFRAVNRLASQRPDLYADVVAGKVAATVALKRKGKNIVAERVAAAIQATVRPEDVGDGEMENRIHCGDAVETLKCVGDGVASLVMFSPPYYGVPIPYDPPLPEQTHDQYLDGLKALLSESYRVSRTGGRLAVIIDSPHNPNAGGDADEALPLFAEVVRIARECGWRYWVDIAWCKAEITGKKTTFGSLGRCSAPGWGRDHEWVLIFFKGQKKLDGDLSLTDLSPDDHKEWWKTTWRLVGETRKDILAVHPAPFPESIPERLIKLLTFRRDLVIDPMSGSGTTIAVAARFGRRFIGVDRSSGYCESARSRVDRALKETTSTPPKAPSQIP